jgi:transcriptional regulator with XRE-family HTH domain
MASSPQPKPVPIDGQPFNSGTSDLGDRVEFEYFLGHQMRQIRKARGLSIPVVAKRAGVSVGLISQIERGLTSPSIRSLRQLATALEVPVVQFFTPANHDGDCSHNIVRPGQRRMLLLPHIGIHTEVLTSDSSGALQMFIANIEPGGSSGPEFDSHDGEEAGLVLSGRLELWVGDRYFILDEGCSFRFSSRTPHRFANPGPVLARVHWVITPPIY